jgi:hypothetical protein
MTVRGGVREEEAVCYGEQSQLSDHVASDSFAYHHHDSYTHSFPVKILNAVLGGFDQTDSLE